MAYNVFLTMGIFVLCKDVQEQMWLYDRYGWGMCVFISLPNFVQYASTSQWNTT